MGLAFFFPSGVVFLGLFLFIPHLSMRCSAAYSSSTRYVASHCSRKHSVVSAQCLRAGLVP